MAGGELVERKRLLRTEMRLVRRSLEDRPERSEKIMARLCVDADVAAARRVMAFDSIPSEPDTSAFVAWCRDQSKSTAMPEDDIEPTWPDVVIVPGLAFTPDGRRCGQGGGWYDRFLTGVRPQCRLIGICFAPQLLDDVPTEPHDLRVHRVITD